MKHHQRIDIALCRVQKGPRQAADDVEPGLLPGMHRVGIGRDDEIELHRAKALIPRPVLGMGHQRPRDALAARIRMGGEAGIGDVAELVGEPVHRAPTGDDQASEYVDVQIDDPQLCNRYTGILIKDVKIGPSPKWMQEQLTKAGMRPINNVVDITNYVMLAWGQPLHAFDYAILKARANRVGDAKPTIIVRRAGMGEKFTTLDNVQRELDDQMLMICDTAGSIAIAGVMGGQESEVSEQTQHILLESAT